jgi:hypothetical protein
VTRIAYPGVPDLARITLRTPVVPHGVDQADKIIARPPAHFYLGAAVVVLVAARALAISIDCKARVSDRNSANAP